MKVHIVDNKSFKSNFYHFRQLNGEGVIDKISTDNFEQLGKTPILITDNERLPMIYDGKYYTANVKYPINQYRIFYEDTGKYENHGNPIIIDKHKISRNILVNDLKNNGKPLQKDISKGTAEGKVVTDIKNIPANEPVILLAGDVNNKGEELTELPPNVFAVIVSDGNIDFLSHISSLYRSYFNLFTILYDEKKYNDLKNLNGKYIHITNTNGNLHYNTITKPTLIQENNKINIPVLSTDKKFLDYKMLNKINSGIKSYRVAQMQDLTEKKVLNDVIIPKGFVISSEYIEKIEDYLNQAKTEHERENKFWKNPFESELDLMCKSVGINPSSSIIRSAFNAEDLYEYPTAGLYNSECCYSIDEFVMTIDSIYKSKDSPKAIESRKRYNIPNNIIQPSVLVQEYIPSDYTFTAYSDLKNNKVLIEIGATQYSHLNLKPTIILYDDKNVNYNIIEHQIYDNKFLIDDKGNILEKEDGENPITENWITLLPMMTVISKNALKLDRYFGKAQDIEGGISKGKVYFWQTRDIVKKALRHL